MRFRFFLSGLAALSLLLPAGALRAQDAPKAAEAPAAVTPAPANPPPPTPADAAPVPPVAVEAPVAPAATPAPAPAVRAQPDRPDVRVRTSVGERVTFGHDAHLGENERAHVVVAIFGSATSHGEVDESVVAVFGNAEVTGPVGEGVVAVMGDSRVNNRVRGDVVVVGGNLALGPRAEIDGEVVVVGGVLTRDPQSVVRRGVNNVSLVPALSGPWVGRLQEWIRRCFLLGRPLALGGELGWAWGIALSFLALYFLFALLFRRGVDKCVTTLEERPGSSVLAALLGTLLSVVAVALLVVTVVGALLLPFFVAALFFVGLFGKAVMLAWLGRRITRVFGDGPLNHPAVAVLVGGAIVLGLYLVPILGFLVFKLIGFLGFGVVVYTILLSTKREKAATPLPPSPPTGGVGPSGFVPVDVPPVSPAGGMPPVMPAAASAAMASPGFGSAPREGDMGAPSAGFPSSPPVIPPAGTLPPSAPPPVALRFTPPMSSAVLPRAGFWIRLAALLLDAILVGVVAVLANDALPEKIRFDLGLSGVLVLLAIYGAAMWKHKGTTVGGIVCGLKVVRLDGREIDWATAAVRALGSFLSLAVAGLGFIWVVVDDEKQSWHDKIAGTTVVHMPRGMALV